MALVKRRIKQSVEPLRKSLGRKLYTQAKSKSRKKTSTKKSEDIPEQRTEPSSGVFAPLSPDREPARARSGNIPIDRSLVETEEALSHLYATKYVAENARQLVLDMMNVVAREELLSGFSATVTVCAVAQLAGTALGKDILPKTAIKDLGLQSKAVDTATRVLRTEKASLQALLAQAQENGKKCGRIVWLSKPGVRMRERWVAPRQTRLGGVMATEDVSGAEQAQALRKLEEAEAERRNRIERKEQVGGRPRRLVRGKTAADGSSGVSDADDESDSGLIPSGGSRKRKRRLPDQTLEVSSPTAERRPSRKKRAQDE